MVAQQSFPRGKKKATDVAKPPQQHEHESAAPPSKKRKQQSDDATPVEVGDALFGKKGLARQGQADADASDKKAVKAKKKPRVESVKKGAADAADAPATLASVVTFKTLKKGMLLLGCVRQINHNDLLVSLPNKLNGVVSLEECSDEFYAHARKQKAKAGKPATNEDEDMEEALPALSEVFQVGQFVPCAVLATSKDDKGKKIVLSLRTSLINAELNPATVAKGMALYGTVASLEDHGAIINLGIRGLNAFVPQRELAACELTPRPGQHLLVTVLSVNAHTSTATVTPDPKQTLKCVTRGDSFTLQQMTPGVLLNVRVEEVLANGLRVSFLTFFSGTVEHNHMSNPCVSDWAESYRQGLKGRARIVSVDRANKQITLSMAPHVVHLSVPEPSLMVGDIVERATIQRIDAGIGMLLSLQSSVQDEDNEDEDDAMDGSKTPAKKNSNWAAFAPAYVHISNASDDRVDKLDKKFTVGQTVRCRVIGTAPFDGLLNVTCKASSLAQTVLRHADLQAGEQVRGKILAVETWGILLEISEGVRGLVTAQHVPPHVLGKKGKKDTSGKYRVGKTVEARVLRVDLETKKTYLTMKKALLTSELPVLSTFADAQVGRVAHGCITKIAEYGVVVSFYGGVYGLVPAALLHQAGIQVLDEAYVLGQVVKGCVTRCDQAKQRLMLTFDTTGAATTKAKTSTSTASATEEASPLVGKLITNAKVLEVDATSLRVQTEDGLEGVLPFVQLSDFPRQTALVDAFVAQWSVGDVIAEPLLVLAQARDGLLTLSKKPLLLSVANQTSVLPRTFAQVKERAVLVGYVASVHATKGVFVRFLNNLSALAPKAFVSESFVAQVDAGLFEVGETVVCQVEKVEKDKQQFLVGFRKHTALASGVKHQAAWFQALTREYAAVGAFTTKYAVGKTEKAEFVGMRPYGAVFTLGDEDDDSAATVIVPGVKKATWDEGATVKLLLVDFDLDKRVFYGSVDAALVKSGAKKARKQKQALAVGARVQNATVVAIGSNKKYVVASYPDAQDAELQHVSVVQLADFWTPSASAESLGLDVGASLPRCRVVAASVGGAAVSTAFDDLTVLAREDEDALAALANKQKKQRADDDEHAALPKYGSDDWKLGKRVTGRIVGIKEDVMEIKLKASKKCGKVVATVSVCDVDATGDDAHPFDQFQVNMRVDGRVLAVLEKGANQRKPVSESNPATFHALHLSLRKADVEGDAELADCSSLARADWQERSAGRALLQEGRSLEGVVTEQNADGLLIRLSHRVVGFAHCLELSSDLAVLRAFRQQFPVGKRLKCNVIGVDEDKKFVHLSLIHTAREQTTPKVGAVLNGLVSTKMSAIKPPCVMVQLGATGYGRACVTELLPPAQWASGMHELPQFAHSQFVRCVVLSSDKKNTELSLRSDALADPKAYVAAQSKPLERAVGDLVPAIVASTAANGCFVRVDRQTTARVLLRDLSDDFVTDPTALFPMGKLVAGRVVKQTAKGLELSLKASVVSDDVAMIKFKDLRVGMTVKGTITKVQPYGVFVKVEKSNISGLCHISEVADQRVTQPLDQVFSEGDYVKAKVLKIEELRVSFGLKPSYFEGEESSSEEEDDDEEEDAENGDDDSDSEDEEPVKEVKEVAAKKEVKTRAVPMDVDDGESSSEDDEAAAPQVGFTWDGFDSVLGGKANDEEDSDSEDEEAEATKQTKKQVKRNDEWIALREKALASNEQVPQSADDYERLLAVSPQSSYLWIQYMAFHVSLTEVALARDVAVRATTKVSFREEKEKLNVWFAYLNLEHDFGDAESFMRVFKSALQVNPPKRVYLHLVDLYDRAGEHEDAKATLATMQKKFKQSKQTWLKALQLQVAQRKHNTAAETLQRALKSLAPHKHLVVIQKYGQLMYEHDAVEKARTIFEGILANYPKRMDLWNVYLDKEVKFGGDHAYVRQLFERLLAMEFSAKKMKFLFKKFLAFEEEHGDEARVEHVKQLAADFVAAAAAATGGSA